MIEKMAIEKVFAILALFFGLIYVFILPPFQSVDEPTHFFRGWEITSGNFVPRKIDTQSGDYLPESVENLANKYLFLIKNIHNQVSLDYILETSKIKTEPNKTKFINFQNTALYSPTCYISQVPGMIIAKSLNANPLTVFYAGRLSNLIFFIIIFYFVIKIIPFFKLTTMLLALMPMTLSLAGALTGDVIVIGFNFLWVAFLLKLMTKKQPINGTDIANLVLIAAILAFSKDYFLLIPLVLILPKSNFESRKNYLSCLFCITIISIFCMGLWHYFINNFSLSMNSSANFHEQLNLILSKPLNYMSIILNTLIIKTPRIIITMIGVLGWQDTRLDFITYMIYPALIVASMFVDNIKTFSLEIWQKSIIFINIVISIVLIFTLLYMMWSDPNSPVIYGLNGKYFTPIMLPILLLFTSNKNFKNANQIKLIIYICIILILISSDLSILHRFYGLTNNLYYQI